MTRARRDGLCLVLLGSVAFLLLGIVLEQAAAAPMVDFKVVYYPARCLIQHRDPYMESEVRRIYAAEGETAQLDSAKTGQIITRNMYPPSGLFLMVPFALLPWAGAHFLASTHRRELYSGFASNMESRSRLRAHCFRRSGWIPTGQQRIASDYLQCCRNCNQPVRSGRLVLFSRAVCAGGHSLSCG